MAWSLIQNPAAANGSGTSVAKAFGSNVTAGNVLIAVATCDPDTTCTFSSSGASWTTTNSFFNTTASQKQFIGVAFNVPGGATTVTATFGTTGSFLGIIIAEFSGGSATSAVDVTSPGRHNASSTTPTDAAIVTTANGDLIISALLQDAGGVTITAGGGATLLTQDTTDLHSAEFFEQTSAGSIAMTFNANPTAATSTTTLSIKVAGTSPSNSPYKIDIPLDLLSELITDQQNRVQFQSAVDQTVNANGIVGGEVVGNNLTASGIPANAIPGAEVLGNALTAPSITTGIASSERVGSPAITTTYTINANGISGSENFGAPAVGQSVTPQAIPGAESVGNPAVTATYTINANGIPSNEFVSNNLTAPVITENSIPTSERLGAPTVSPAISAFGVTSAESLGNPAVTTTYTINANGIPSSEISGNSNTVTATSVAVQSIPGAEQVGSPAVAATYTITAHGIPTGSAVGNTQVSPVISENSITSAESLGNPSVTVITAINAGSIPPAESLGNAAVTSTYTINAQGIPSAERSGNSNVTAAIIISAGSITSNENFGRAAITTGPVTVSANSITSGERFGSSIVSLGALSLTIQALGITSEAKIGSPFTGPQIVDAIIWKAEANVIYVADPTLISSTAIDDVVYAADDLVDAMDGPDQA